MKNQGMELVEGADDICIKRIKIKNFKCFKGSFELELNNGLNILVGDNEAGKSTILEAVHLVLTGLINGKYLKTELTQYLFNNEIVAEYVTDIAAGKKVDLPEIIIELYLAGKDAIELLGNHNSEKLSAPGVSLKISLDDKYRLEYESFFKAGEIKTIPIEYYDFTWESFARKNITPKLIPLKSALIDSATNRNQNGSDVYISRIVRDFLDEEELVQVYQAHRQMKEGFVENKTIVAINTKLKTATDISRKDVKLSVDLSSKNAWENSLLTYLDDVPFHNIGKGEQCLVKTKLALSHKKTKAANLILLEEPENHLSHTKLNELIYDIKSKSGNKQLIVSTHSSFVANKLGLESLILLNNKIAIRLKDLEPDTKLFFEKLAGYDTLRLILCDKAILVEGDSDELVVQKAYYVAKGKLPIEDKIDIISVGTSFLRFLEIADKIQKPVVVVTDNDGNIAGVEKKYEDYLGDNAKSYIKICYDNVVDTGTLKIGAKDFNYNTLEPKLLKENGLKAMNLILKTKFSSDDELHTYMKGNKTECALKIFDVGVVIKLPKYITDSIS